jgi:glutaredoxin
VSLVLISRQDCHLCDLALSLLRELGFEAEVADVDADPNLLATYDWRVPVILRDDRVIAEGHITRAQLEKALKPA